MRSTRTDSSCDSSCALSSQPSGGVEGAHPDCLERFEGAGSILLAQVEVDVVVGRRAATRPGREPAAKHRRHAGLVESGAGALHRVDQLAADSHSVCIPRPSRTPAEAFAEPPVGVSRWTMDEMPIRLAAAADLHCAEPLRERTMRAFNGVQADADLILLGGDLTTHGEPEQALVLADACRDLAVPVIAVLGNHDHHADRCGELTATLEAAGIIVLDRSHIVIEVEGIEVGIVGCKGFVGGFPGAEITDFGEPLLRRLYQETGDEVTALEEGLEAISGCHRRIVLLHYAPIAETLVGEPERIWAFLGSGRLAGPIGAHRPDLVLHGHAHHGSPEGLIGEVRGAERRRARDRRRFRPAPLLSRSLAMSRACPADPPRAQQAEQALLLRLERRRPRRELPLVAAAKVIEGAPFAELLDARPGSRTTPLRRLGCCRARCPTRRIAAAIARVASVSDDGGPCSARATAAVRLPPHVRKSFAVNPPPRCSARYSFRSGAVRFAEAALVLEPEQTRPAREARAAP